MKPCSISATELVIVRTTNKINSMGERQTLKYKKTATRIKTLNTTVFLLPASTNKQWPLG
jgi:hypothetical protein